MTAFTSPPCPNCGGVLRPINYNDLARCRCGLEVSAVAIVSARTKGRPLSVADGHFVPIPQAAPGIRVGRNFAEVTRDAWDARQEPLPAGFPDLEAHAERYGVTLGLRLQRHPFLGKHLVVRGPDGNLVQIEREMVYALCRTHEVVECTERMVELIAAGGPGNWWATAGAVHAIADDGLVRFCDVGGEPHIYLRALYGVCRDKRDPNVIRQAAQAVDRRASEAVAKLSASAPSESISTGDCVRWWPDGRDNDGRLIRDRYIDGEVVSLSPTCMRIAESHGFTERIHGGWLRPSIGSVFDTSVSPGVIRRIPRAGAPQLVKPDVIMTDLDQPWTNARATGNVPLWLKSQRQLPNGRYECAFSKSPVDPLDVKYDGATLRTLLEYDEGRRRETHPNYVAAAARRTHTQRSAVSSHWSAQLRAKVEASRKADLEREVSVRYCEEDD